MGNIINSFSGVEAGIDSIISIYFGKIDTMNDLTTFIHELNFDVKIEALRIAIRNKCPDLIKNVPIKYLLYENQNTDIFYRAMRNFKQLRNAVAHSLVKDLAPDELTNFTFPDNLPMLEFEVFERPNTYKDNDESYIKVRRKLSSKKFTELAEDCKVLGKILHNVLNSVSGLPPAF